MDNLNNLTAVYPFIMKPSANTGTVIFIAKSFAQVRMNKEISGTLRGRGG